MPSFKQRDITDCGAACLGYVLHHYGLTVSVALLRQAAGTSQRGTSALGLVESASRFGLSAKGIRGEMKSLQRIPCPAIAHVLIDGKREHFVVLHAVRRNGFKVMDPATGRVEAWSTDKFKAQWSGVVVLLAPGVKFQPGVQSKSAMSRLWELLVPQRAVITQIFFGAVVATLLSLSSAIFVQKIIDDVIVDGNRSLLRLMGCVMLVILACRLAFGYLQQTLVRRAAQQIDVALILGYYRHLLSLPQSFFDTMRVGEITSRLRDAVTIRGFINGSIVSLLLQPLLLVFGFSGMFFYSAKLALLSLALLPLNAVVYMLSDWRNKRFQRQLLEKSADFDAQLVESLHAAPIVKAFRLEERMGLKTEGRLVNLLKTGWDATTTGLVVNTVGSGVTQLYSLVLLWSGASLVLDGELTAGELMSCSALAGYMTGPIVALIGMNASIRQALTATERLYEIIDLQREPDDGNVELASEAIGDIRFEGVSFKYPGRLPVLVDCSLTIPQGQITAIVGESGGGKSTLFGLLQRLYVPDSGRISIGDTELPYVRLDNLRSMIAVVPQRVDLLSGTVVENLAPRNYAPDMKRLMQVCREVGALGFIEKLPAGFKTHLSENGINLSGGQRQRLALARALYADAQIILLDEPSSSLDGESEEILMNAIVKLRAAGRTVVIATHSRDLLAVADCVMEVRAGRVSARRPEPVPAASLVFDRPLPNGHPIALNS